MELKKRLILFLILFFIPIFSIWLFQDKYLILKGETMGTTYTMKVYVDSWRTKSSIQTDLEKLFDSINATFSTWDKSSELSQFNNSENINFISPSADLLTILNKSSEIYKLSKGAFDPTIKPLFDLWGFGENNIYFEVPDSKKIAEIRDFVGYDKLIIKEGKIKKTHPNLSLDLSSLVKGYCIDKVAQFFASIGASKYMIEIGGEVRVGDNKSKSFWNIGVIRPDLLNSQSNLLFTLKLNNISVATSGDYKNYFEKDGKTYSHIFDPRFGKPISNNIASVTVIAKDCTLADALATALSVVGVNRGLSIVESYDNVECMFVVRDSNNELQAFSSSGFSQFVVSSEIQI